ncbi:hypothetical protein TRFO_18075 [Tritrichomonas foetus]|uniref:Uncharacterized protein n=1 Tax=Tritrichomonas foetus TaxID=1144522 RepID=A0A1J4KRG5_9EUKA|nr:hypothetical protein TRFO_18075 [Tritrichomonas foetus]|eukprot:OHT12262.1 hypothetical protein TRFO_18075 [Tritrichomonas foetus]
MAETTFALTRGKAMTAQKRKRARTSMSNKRSASAKTQTRNSFATRKIHYIVKDQNQFGATSPSWTIPSSRKPPAPPPDYPPPGQYDIQSDIFKRQFPHTIQEREFADYSTITSHIDYIDYPKFPGKLEIRHNYVPERPPDGEIKFSYIPQIDSPGPKYLPGEVQPKHNYRQHNIGEHKVPKEKPVEATPSPAEYTPVHVDMPRAPAYSFDKIVVSDDRLFRRKPEDLPGPGSYNVGPQVRRAPKWTEKIRVYPKRKRNTEPEMIKPWESIRYM